MKILDETPDAPPSRNLVPFIAGGVLLVLVLLGAAWFLRGRPDQTPVALPAPSPAPAATSPEPSRVASPAPEVPSASPTTTNAERRRGPRTKAATSAPAATEPAAPALTLKVDSDVPGTDVFIDRVYLGKTPLTTSDVKPGAHVLNASAEGYEGQAIPIDVSAGANDVSVRFKVVRLNEAIAVVHKHALGSCEGRLLADTHGVRYQTSNKDHAFAIAFSDVRSLEVDYLQKNLRLTRKDGKTFNFTDRAANADALFVFQKKVEAARAKLAAGVPPAEK